MMNYSILSKGIRNSVRFHLRKSYCLSVLESVSLRAGSLNCFGIRAERGGPKLARIPKQECEIKTDVSSFVPDRCSNTNALDNQEKSSYSSILHTWPPAVT